MIFRDTIGKVLDGTKTQTRRLVKNGDTSNAHYSDWLKGHKPKVYRNGRLKWEVGRIYAIQPGRGLPGQGWFKLLAIGREKLQEITDADAIAEGVSKYYKYPHWYPGEAIAQFIHLWDSIHKKAGDRWLGNPEVWVLELELVKSET